MACVEIPPGNADSEMEEGEIVDDLDDLSDISSEEEFLLRQRLQVLENYNNVLERKKAKNSSFGPDSHKDVFLQDLSEISGTDLEDAFTNVKPKIVHRHVNDHRHSKLHHKIKRRKDLDTANLGKTKENKKKVHRKKKLELKVISETSEESDDEYRNKRRKLANAVTLNRNTNDKSSLQDRLQKMLSGKVPDTFKVTEDKQTETETGPKVEDVSCSPIAPQEMVPCIHVVPENVTLERVKNQDACILIDLCTDDDSSTAKTEQPSIDTVDSVTKVKSEAENKITLNTDSDEDLELLRQHALKSKTSKPKLVHQHDNESDKPINLFEDEDSDTTELRLICLKSALLKKAIEMKQKQKLRKRLSQSSFSLQDDPLDEYKELENKLDHENNTDIESVDMDMGSDNEEKVKEPSNENAKVSEDGKVISAHIESNEKDTPKAKHNDDELEEDEDLLRAKLLTSLSKNLPNLVNPKVTKESIAAKVSVEMPKENTPPPAAVPPKTKVPENRIVINLGESDSEGEEHEATKNLTKMHMKLSEHVEFQQKLDMFLKSTRMEVEKKKLPDVVQNPIPKPTEKFVAKTVNHLPKSEQIEYKNLVKKMAELEKIKEARQSAMNIMNQAQIKDTLKPRNVSIDTTRIVAINMLEEQVAMSRKRIAEESARMLKLKEEATKLSQKYKIVATELKNISTAITLNKKEQRTVQNRLFKIRSQHQRLLTSSSFTHSKPNGNSILTVNRTNILQKENNPLTEEIKNPQVLKSVKISVVNDISEEPAPNTRLSVQVDVNSNNRKTVLMADNVEGIEIRTNKSADIESLNESDASCPMVKKGGGMKNEERISAVPPRSERRKEFDDYESPLQSLERASWEADPNGILCPFEVGGNCKDPDCKYLHPKLPSQ